MALWLGLVRIFSGGGGIENLMKKIGSGFWWLGWWGVWLVVELDVACRRLVGVEVLRELPGFG